MQGTGTAPPHKSSTPSAPLSQSLVVLLSQQGAFNTKFPDPTAHLLNQSLRKGLSDYIQISHVPILFLGTFRPFSDPMLLLGPP